MLHHPSRHLARIVAAVVLAVPLTVFGGPKQDSRAKFARASKALKEGRLDDALADLHVAYKLDPRPELLYAIGQVYVKLGKCADAATYYERFLATRKDPDMKSLVQQALEACTPPEPPPPSAAPEPAPAAAPEPSPPPIEPPPPPPAPIAPPPPVAHSEPSAPPRHPEPVPVRVEARSPWYTDKLGDALVVGGVATAVVGLVVYRSAVSELDAAETAPSLDQYNQLDDEAHSKRTYSVVLAAGGVALVGAGIIHYIVGGRGTEARSVAVVPARGGGVVTWTGGF